MKYAISGRAGILCAFLALATALQSCREDIIINGSVTPAVDNINTFGIGPEFGNDTMTLLTRTVYDDSVVTNAGSYLALGWINQANDVFTGNLAGSLFLQVIPPSTQLTLPSVPDSGFLNIPFSGFVWGDTTMASTQHYLVYEITDNTLSKDSTYYSFSDKKADLTKLIGEGTLVMGPGSGHLVDSTPVFGVNRAPHLRLKLKGDFLNEITQVLSDTANSGSPAAFISKFNGFLIVPDTTPAAGPTAGRAMPYFQLTGGADIFSQANMVLYKFGKDTTTWSFPFNGSYAGYFNRITRRFSTDPQVQQLFRAQADTLMVQNQPGAAIDIRLPYVSSLPQNAIINKAQIALTRISLNNDDKYFGPARIYPIGVNDFGMRYSVADRYPLTTNEGLDFIDGKPHVLTIGGVTFTQYLVNVPRELQQAIALRKRELHLRINGTQTFPGAYRLVTQRRTIPAAANKIEFNIVYSKLK